MNSEIAPHASMYEVMADYFFDETSALPAVLEIYYWFYHFNDIRTARAFGGKLRAAVPIVWDLLKFSIRILGHVEAAKKIQLNLGKLLPN